MRPTQERIEEIRQMERFGHLEGVEGELLAEIDALRQDVEQLRGVIESQKHVGNEEARLAARVRELERLMLDMRNSMADWKADAAERIALVDRADAALAPTRRDT